MFQIIFIYFSFFLLLCLQCGWAIYQSSILNKLVFTCNSASNYRPVSGVYYTWTNFTTATPLKSRKQMCFTNISKCLLDPNVWTHHCKSCSLYRITRTNYMYVVKLKPSFLIHLSELSSLNIMLWKANYYIMFIN